MSRLVEINLGRGNLEEGFYLVTVRLDKTIQLIGSLPPAPKLKEIYYRWQSLYQSLYQSRRFAIRKQMTIETMEDDFEIDENDITNVSEEDFVSVGIELENYLNQWLEDKDFLNIERKLRQQLSPEEEIIFILESEDYFIKKIPWHLWQFFNDYPLTEVALSNLYFEPQPTILNKSKKVRILAILGDSYGINVESDRQILASLKNTETVFLVEPNTEELFSYLWDEKGWDILFFSGHSETDEANYRGYIHLNKTEKLTIKQLKNALVKSIGNGLQLAIFNSCDGLGLGKELADLFIPQTILMREPVADQVAQKFLQYFLEVFSGGQSLYLSVKEARQRLQGIETEFPGASWLPIIWQNPAVIPPIWEDLCFTSHALKRKIKAIMTLCVGVLTAIIALFGFSNSASANEVNSDNLLPNFGNFLQQQSFNLEQFNNYLKSDFQEDYLNSNFLNSLNNICSQLKQNNVPSLDELNNLKNNLKQQIGVSDLSENNNLESNQIENNLSSPSFSPASISNDELSNSVENIEQNLEELNNDLAKMNNTLEQINEYHNSWLEHSSKVEAQLEKYNQNLTQTMNNYDQIINKYYESLRQSLSSNE
jgi:hypothetical protein